MASTSSVRIDKPNILIIGAGVIGLSTGILLQETCPDLSPITIVAAEIPTTPNPSADYASMWAGAHYRPVPRSNSQSIFQGDLSLVTMARMKTIAQRHPEAGVGEMKGIEHLDNPAEAYYSLKTGDVYAGQGDNFRILDDDELPDGAKWGCEYDTYCVNVPVYTRWLLDQFSRNGGKVIERRLRNLEEAFDVGLGGNSGNELLVVNCSGRNFDTDPKVQIIRGQTVLVKQLYDKTITRQNTDGTWFAVLPRPPNGGTVIGVTKEIGDLETKPRMESRQHLLEAAVKNCPDFVDSVDKFEVIRDNVGRRPARDGGFRFETEVIPGKGTVVHGYGAGGSGYELSWGAAGEIVKRVKDTLSAKPNL